MSRSSTRFLVLLSSAVTVLTLLLPVAIARADHDPIHTEQVANCRESGGVWDSDSESCVPISGSDCEFEPAPLNLPTWYRYLPSELVSGKCRPVIDGPLAALPIALAIFEIALTLGGLIAVVMVFTGGFKYVLAQGEADKAAGGRKTVVNAIIGLIITIIATRVVAFIGNRLG